MQGKPEVTVPVVHLNGTSAAELLALREKAYTALDEALKALCQMAPNGRDYYPDPGRMEKALEQHQRRCKALSSIMDELMCECEQIQGWASV